MEKAIWRLMLCLHEGQADIFDLKLVQARTLFMGVKPPVRSPVGSIILTQIKVSEYR